MKRIKIDTNLIKVVEDFNANLFSENIVEYEKKINKRIGRKKIRLIKTKGKKGFKLPKNGLYDLYKITEDNDQKAYLKKLFKEYSQLLNLRPSEFLVKKNEFDAIYIIDGVDGSDSTKFAKKIVEILRYDVYRNSQYPKIMHDLGWNMKTCFYCNYAGTLTVLIDSNYKAYYDLDHVLPKSIYPFLATSFFNFIPCCASCNRSKSDKMITSLNPFYETNESDFTLSRVFYITQKSKVQFYNNLDRNLIQINVAGSINNISKTDLDNIVDLELLYNTQKHEAEEILWKKKIYSKAYFKSVQSAFSKLHLKKHEMNRILWGTDLNEETINDKPLAKFKFDLIKDR